MIQRIPIPIAEVIKTTKYNFIVKCPYCKEQHHHGKKEGIRVAHCGDFRSYRVVLK